MAASLAARLRLFRQARSTISSAIVRISAGKTDAVDVIGNGFLRRSYAIRSSTSDDDFHEEGRRPTSGVSRHGRQPFFEEIRDEFSEHHLAKNTASRMEKLSLLHRQGATSEHLTENKSFRDFDLDESLIEKLEALGYKSPFAIQTKTLEYTLNARDVIGRAVTGSGKTLAFAIPIVNKLRQSDPEIVASRRKPRAIVLSPTRELCNQIYRSIQELDRNVRCVALYGGASYNVQERDLSRGVDVICATPGRLNDHIDRGNIDLSRLDFLCLDEADEMLTPNFREQIHNIFHDSPKTKQVLMFSATMPPDVREIAHRYLNDPVYVDITDGNKSKAPQGIEHQCMRASPMQHAAIVANLVAEHEAERCIVFLNTKARTNSFAMSLKRHGLRAEAINSDLSQNRREAILSAFRLGDLKILCATDVAARGLDIPETDLIVQVGPPDKGLEFYIHRSGRTGRAGRKGLAVLLHAGYPSEIDIINQISRTIPLQHIAPPEKLNEALREKNLEKALNNLQKVSQKDIETFLPAAQKLFDESKQDGTSLLAAALSMLSRSNTSDVDLNDSSVAYSSLNRRDAARSSRSTSNYQHNRIPVRRKQRLFNDWDENELDFEEDVRRSR